MIDFINIKNFKTLLNTSFPFSSLNLFSGLNGMGKSEFGSELTLAETISRTQYIKK